MDDRCVQANTGQIELSQMSEQARQFHMDQWLQLSVRKTGVAGILSRPIESGDVAVRAERSGDGVELHAQCTENDEPIYCLLAKHEGGD